MAAVVETLVEHGWVIPVPAPARSGAGTSSLTGVPAAPPGSRPQRAVHGPEVATESTVSAERPTHRALTEDGSPAESAESAEPDDAEGSADTADIADTSPPGPLPAASVDRADSADIADTSTTASCIGCGKPLPTGVDGCAACYAAGRIDDDGRPA